MYLIVFIVDCSNCDFDGCDYFSVDLLVLCFYLYVYDCDVKKFWSKLLLVMLLVSVVSWIVIGICGGVG